MWDVADWDTFSLGAMIMKFDTDELDLEFMEQEAEDHLTEREALLLGLQQGGDSEDLAFD